MKPNRKGILMILSPAKTLDLGPYTATSQACTRPECDDTKTRQVIQAMKKRKQSELGKLLGVSANLAKTAHEYWSNVEVNVADRNAIYVKPCIFAFSGAAYQGLQAKSLDDSSLSYLQENLRIVDPLYGLLRPMDTIQPYRLEMATHKVFDDSKTKLATWWQPSVTASLAQDLSSREDDDLILLNLASDEYSAAVDVDNLPNGTKFVKVIFWENGRVISVHAKRARGLMARYLAENSVNSLNEVQKFDLEGYKFVESASDESTLVFDRSKRGTSKSDKKPAAKKRRTR